MEEAVSFDLLSVGIVGLIVIGAILFIVLNGRKAKSMSAEQNRMLTPETVRAAVTGSEKSEMGKRKYVILMQTEDGRKIRLDVTYEQYMKLRDPVRIASGSSFRNAMMQGMLTYHGTLLLNFEPDAAFQQAYQFR